LGRKELAEPLYEKALILSKEWKLETLHANIKRAKLEKEGKIEEARNPYFWDDTTGK
jgi:hypothetical protein